MSNDAILVLQCLFGSIWRLFTSWHIPGTSVTPAAAFLFLICASIGFKFLGRMVGIGVNLEEVAEARSSFRGMYSARRLMGNGESVPIYAVGRTVPYSALGEPKKQLHS